MPNMELPKAAILILILKIKDRSLRQLLQGASFRWAIYRVAIIVILGVQKDHPRMLQRRQRWRQFRRFQWPKVQHHMADVTFLIVVDGHHPRRAQFLQALIAQAEALAQPFIIDHRRR
jgi:hypothetical protein